MKYLKTYEQHWVGPPPEWDDEPDHDDEVEAANTFVLISTEIVKSADINKSVFDYSNSLAQLFDVTEEHIQTKDFVLIPIQIVKLRHINIVKMQNFREMVENSELTQYYDNNESDFNLWEWNQIKGIDYEIETDPILNEDGYRLEGICIATDNYNKLIKLSKKILLNEEFVIAYLKGDIDIKDLEDIKDIL